MVGSIQPILVEGFSEKQISGGLEHLQPAAQWTGRTSTNKIVHFFQYDNPENCADIAPGELIHVKIEVETHG